MNRNTTTESAMASKIARAELTIAIALPHAITARLLALVAAREDRAAAWRDSKEIIGWDTPMDCGPRMARLHALLTLMAVYNGRPSLASEAFDEFLRVLTGEKEPQADTQGAKAFQRAAGWLTATTREGIIKLGPVLTEAE